MTFRVLFASCVRKLDVGGAERNAVGRCRVVHAVYDAGRLPIGLPENCAELRRRGFRLGIAVLALH